MPPRSKVRKMPDDLRAELDRLLSNGKLTLTEITDHLKKLGADVSRTSVGRYSQEFDRLLEDARWAREMAAGMRSTLSDLPEADTGLLLIEQMQAVLLRARVQIQKDPDERIKASELGKLTRSVLDLQQAFKINVDAQVKVQERTRKEAAENAARVAVKHGLSGETVRAIKAEILGVKENA